MIENKICSIEVSKKSRVSSAVLLEGKFPQARQVCLDTIERYLGMPVKERLNYRLGRRAGLYEKLNDIFDAAKYDQIDLAMRHVGADTAEKVDELIDGMKKRFI